MVRTAFHFDFSFHLISVLGECCGMSPPTTAPSTIEVAPTTTQTQAHSVDENIPPLQLLASGASPVIHSSFRSERQRSLSNIFVDDSSVPFQTIDLNVITSLPVATAANAIPILAAASETVTTCPTACTVSSMVTIASSVDPSLPCDVSTWTSTTSTTTNVSSSVVRPVPSSQFFATSLQRRRQLNRNNKNSSSSNVGDSSNVMELRCQFIRDERENYCKAHAANEKRRVERHALRMEILRSEHAARLNEIKIRNEYRAAIHAKSTLFWEAAIGKIENEPEIAANRVTRVVAIAEQDEIVEGAIEIVDACERVTDNENANDYVIDEFDEDDSESVAYGDQISDMDYLQSMEVELANATDSSSGTNNDDPHDYDYIP